MKYLSFLLLLLIIMIICAFSRIENFTNILYHKKDRIKACELKGGLIGKDCLNYEINLPNLEYCEDDHHSNYHQESTLEDTNKKCARKENNMLMNQYEYSDYLFKKENELETQMTAALEVENDKNIFKLLNISKNKR